MKSKKEYQFKKFIKVRKIKKNKIKSDRKKPKDNEIVKKKSILKTISNKRNSYLKNKDQIWQMKKKSMEDEIEKEFQFYKLLKIKRIVIKRKWTKSKEK